MMDLTIHGWAWAGMIVAACATYVWRGLSVPMSGRLDPDGRLFRWVGCVAFALLAGLIARMIFMPVGPLVSTPDWARLIALLAALTTFYLGRRSTLYGVMAGSTVLTLASLAAK
jgi:branched-subunit amino acid transport protein